MGFLTFLSDPPNDRINFVYKLGGEPTEINVFELAPTLLALGQLIQDGNRSLFPNGQEIAVNVKPFKQGSFIVDIVLFPTDSIHEILNLVQHTSGEQIMYLLGSLGVLAKGTDLVAKASVSVLKAIRELRGKTEKVEELKPGEFRYTSDNNSVTVGKDVHTLLQNPTIVNNIYNVYGKPLENEKIEDVESYIEEDDETTKVTTTKEDVPFLRAFAGASAFEAGKGKDDTRIVSGVFLNPRRGAYSGDGKQWSFHRGKSVIIANIKDENFLQKVQSGEIRPHYTDLMTVTMSEKQKAVGTKVTVTHEILSVDDYEFGGKQIPLLDKTNEPKALPPAPDDSRGQ